MGKIKGVKESKVGRIMRAPLRALIKARDLYIKSMTQCSSHFDYGAAMGCPTAHVNTTLTRSFSTSSVNSNNNNSTQDFRELVKAASTRTLANNKIINHNHQKSTVGVGSRPHNKLPKSRSVGFGRIDEDKACDEFEERDDQVMIRTTSTAHDAYPRSKSYAVHRRTLF
ncbi:uncharacterized protein LOC115714569 [Cannabis sativa]|uniref:uncharacterized protein LOC115714569 n=1 Tax=Cannabis sativa TaxID=3483 RepID=UPI0029CA296A|nr:uncharacterized protein LOC115714569 [Cannabis sativa]